MLHRCQYLCSELVTVTFEEAPGEIRQHHANLEEISTESAVVLLDEEPRLGAAISIALSSCDLYGTVVARMFDTVLGWFVTIRLDAASMWNRLSAPPKYLLELCACSLPGVSGTKVSALEGTRNTEENVPVIFLGFEAQTGVS